jgi:hypothetical protein
MRTKNSASYFFDHSASDAPECHPFELNALLCELQIVVLEQGHVVERGTHEQLLQLDGRYAQMWAQQQSLVETGEAEPLPPLELSQ